MNIKIRSKNFDITPAIDEYATKKISSLQKFLGGEENVLCEIEIERTTHHHKSGDIFRAEVNIVYGGKQIFAVAEEPDFYTSIDVVRDEAEREIVSKKNKAATLFRKGASQIKDLLRRVKFKRRP